MFARNVREKPFANVPGTLKMETLFVTLTNVRNERSANVLKQTFLEHLKGERFQNKRFEPNGSAALKTK
jgi:hypothetical protein